MPLVPPLDTDRYYSYQELAVYLQEVAAAVPHVVRLVSIGESYEGRPLLLAEVTNHNMGEAADKPALWLDGNTHAAELAGSMACLDVLYRLAEGHGRDPVVTHLLDSRAFYILPRLSPDGAEHCLATGDVVRSGTRPYPFEDAEPGLVPADVDGDGRIRQMRVRDPLGEWKVSRRDPRLLIPRAPDDREGTFYRLYREGIVRDHGPGPVAVARERYALDFNRNFPYDWRPEEEQAGSGPYPLSEPETRAVADFFRHHPNIGAALSFHTFSSVLLRPYSARPDAEMHPEDLALYRELGRRGTELTGYPCVSAYEGFRYGEQELVRGAFDDWAYHHLGVLAFTSELWSIGLAAGLEIRDPVRFLLHRTETENLAILRWIDRELGGKGFHPWTEFHHPQLGLVEIGGWDLLTTWFNPPPGRYLAEEIRKNSEFALALAACLPRLAVRSFRDEPLGWAPGEPARPLRRLVLELENQGYLPTWVTRRALEAGRVEPLQVELELGPGVELRMGRVCTRAGQLAGTGSIHSRTWSDALWFRGESEEQRRRLEWLVEGEGEVAVRVSHSRAGRVEARAVREGEEEEEAIAAPLVSAAPPQRMPSAPAPTPAVPAAERPVGRPRQSPPQPILPARGVGPSSPPPARPPQSPPEPAAPGAEEGLTARVLRGRETGEMPALSTGRVLGTGTRPPTRPGPTGRVLRASRESSEEKTRSPLVRPSSFVSRALERDRQPAESEPASDPPDREAPEAPPAASKIPAPLLLRRSRKQQ